MSSILQFKPKPAHKLFKSLIYKSLQQLYLLKLIRQSQSDIKTQLKSEVFSTISPSKLKSIVRSRKKIDKFGSQKLTLFCRVAPLLFLLKEQSRIRNAVLPHKWSTYWKSIQSSLLITILSRMNIWDHGSGLTRDGQHSPSYSLTEN